MSEPRLTSKEQLLDTIATSVMLFTVVGLVGFAIPLAIWTWRWAL